MTVVGPGGETRNGRGGEQNELMGCEELIHMRPEGFVTFAEATNFDGGQTCAPVQSIADGGFELIEVAGVDSGGFRGLYGRED